MARPRTIYVDAEALLLAIASATVETAAEFSQIVASYSGQWYGLRQDDYQHARYELQMIEADGVAYDLERFADRALSGSERVVHQRTLREMHSAGLVTLNGLRATRVKLTAEGWAKTGVSNPFAKERTNG